MNSLNLYFLNPVLSLALTLILTPLIRKIAMIINLVDKPDARKVHQNEIPLVGGIAIIFSSGLTLLLGSEIQAVLEQYPVLVSGSLILLMVGVVDDKMRIRSIIKLFVQISIACFVVESGVKIESFYGVFGIYSLPDLVQYVFTITVIVGVINAFNLMDGIDGLAAGLAIVGFSSFACVAYVLNQTFLLLIYLALIGALIGFLKFNLSQNEKIFMGDAGSLMLGYVFVVSGIMLIQSANGTTHVPVTLSVVIGFLSLPVVDSLRVYRSRIKEGKSPFQPDRTHLHHLLLSAGLRHHLVSSFIIAISVSFVLLAIVSGFLLSITVAILVIVMLFAIIATVLVVNTKLNVWKEKVKKLELPS